MILFLSADIIRAIHKAQIDLYGGTHGIRDPNILDAALNLPKVQFGGQFLHSSIFHKPQRTHARRAEWRGASNTRPSIYKMD